MGKQVLNTITTSSAIIVMAALAFFWLNEHRVGEIIITPPEGGGPSIALKVQNSIEISELIRNGLADQKSAETLTNVLLSIIEGLSPGSTLGEKLVELAERRKPPFLVSSVPVKLVYSPQVPSGRAGVCEKSSFLAKNIVVYVLSDNGDLLFTFPAYADVTLTFPCPDGGETLRINATEVEAFKRHKMMAKRAF